tara:strand:+ start:230 stop:499 length:270 start_codon:yes stop_codon:yes gene_type:complete
MTIEFILVGVLGGLVRALYGLLKAVNNGIVINQGYFLISLIISGLIGGLLGSIIAIDFRIAALAGYVGTDILENIFAGALPSSITIRKK